MAQQNSLPAQDSQLLNLRVPPHSIEAEQSVLGGLLLDNQAFDKIADVVSPDDFYRDEHRRIYFHIARLVERSKPADVLTVSDSIEASDDRERSIMRRLITTANEIADTALSPMGKDVGQLLDEAESKIFQINEAGSRGKQGFVPMSVLAPAVQKYVDELHQSGNLSGITGVPTGFSDLDQKTSGFQKGDLVIIAGRPSMGKTALALNIAEHVGVHNGLPVGVFSMEMSGPQLALRMLGSISRVDQMKLRTGRGLTDEDWSEFATAVGKLQDAPIHIDETPALNTLELRARARRLHRQYGGLHLIIVDYLQLMSSSSQGENRATEISEISRSLKALAKELQVPVIALSQLNRSLENRTDKRPVMSDLRESGAIEQDADVILFIYRDEVYNKVDGKKGEAELIIGKQRNGPTGTVMLTFLGQHTRFANWSSGDGGWSSGSDS